MVATRWRLAAVFAALLLAPAAYAQTDYDDDDDSLIDIRSLGQLNAVRWDLNGDGTPVASASTTYAAAFPNAASGMGCPSTCIGYELRANLNFDTNGDGDVDGDDSPSFPNWTPIGPYAAPYTAEFKGNNRTISNLTITGNSSLFRFGLFGTLGSGGTVSGVGMVDVNIDIPQSGTPSTGSVRAGALLGYNDGGTVRSSYSTGSVSLSAAAPHPHSLEVGGLAGVVAGGTIAASWSAADVSATGADPTAGGLVGQLGFGTSGGSVTATYARGAVVAAGGSTTVRSGGLVGQALTSSNSVTASYATGAASATGATTHVGGLLGANISTPVSASYWDTDLSGIDDDGDADPPEGRTTAQLSQPMGYTGLYAAWDDQDVDGDGAAGEAVDDDAWDFGTRSQLPVLKFGGLDTALQFALQSPPALVVQPPPALVLLPDPGLRRAVEIALGKPPGSALTESDLLTLTSLNTAAGVRTLDGLEAASRLESLTLSGNAPAAGGAALDIQVLAGLRSLTHLDLSDNGLSDISALASLTGLRTLLLGGNAVEDLSPLAGLTGLEELTLSGNGLADVSALAGLSALQQLWLDGNALTDVGPLSGLGSLRYLHLGDNRIEELSPLSGLSELRRLWLPGNRVADVSALSGLRRLKRLDLSRNMVVNTAPLAGLPELSLLRLGWNRVADVSPLAGHAALTDGGVLGLRGNPLGADALERQVPALREAGAAVVAGWAVPLFPSASAPSGRGGFVRVLNRSETAGEVLVEAVDEAGRRFGPVRLALGPRQAAHFNSADLADGNAAKGLPEGVGPLAQGSWRLVVSSVLDIEVLSYLRGPGGFVTAAHGALPRDGERLSAFVFNPGGDRTQRSSLRVLNPGASVVNISAWGVDDAGRGRLATGFAAPAGGALAVTARELESSRRSGPGLGKGEGRWRLAVGAPWPVEALSLLESPGGHLSNLSSAPVQAGADEVLRLPLFPSASAGSGRQGFARVANLTAHDGWAEVSAVDDAGVRAGPARLRLPARATVHFDAADLEMGNVANGLSPGLGAPTRGSWRLELRSALDLRAGAYARHADGFLTSLHEAAPSAAGVARVAVFNPASNERQRSLLRLVNDGEEAARATITGRDDAGAEAGPVSVTVPAGEALTLTAVQLEEGAEAPAPRMEMEGTLGDGAGKWRLSVVSDDPLVVMSLMENPTGHLANLSASRP